jgi:hypothetical protein
MRHGYVSEPKAYAWIDGVACSGSVFHETKMSQMASHLISELGDLEAEIALS